MADNRTFSKLVSELNLDERHELLTKLNGQSDCSNEPLYEEPKKAAIEGDFESRYAKLPWYWRLWYFLLSLFQTKSALRLFQDSQIAELGRLIDQGAPGLYDYQKYLLLQGFQSRLEYLKDAARIFYAALDSSVNRDKGAFFAFLGSLEMPNIHKALQTRTDPALIAEASPGLTEQEMHREALSGMDEILETITEEDRKAMYSDARSLLCLKELSSFLFDRIIMAFSFEPSLNGSACSVNVVKELLISLNDILYSMKAIPPMTLLESLFVFQLQEREGESGFNIDSEIHSLLVKAESALGVIRRFNRQVPLTLILRCACRDLSLSPRPVSGGEDWFLFYREYWKRHIEETFADYLRGRREREVFSSFRRFLKDRDIKLLENAASSENPGGFPVEGSLHLAFLAAFYSAVFIPDINKVLRPILIDGDFYQKENKNEFTESYNNFIKLEDEIKKFDAEISPAGDYGKRYEQLKMDMSSLPVRRRKVQLLLEEAGQEAWAIINRIKESAVSMAHVLGGILVQDRNQRLKYDTLENLTHFVEMDSGFINKVIEAMQQFQDLLRILDDISESEGGAVSLG